MSPYNNSNTNKYAKHLALSKDQYAIYYKFIYFRLLDLKNNIHFRLLITRHTYKTQTVDGKVHEM